MTTDPDDGFLKPTFIPPIKPQKKTPKQSSVVKSEPSEETANEKGEEVKVKEEPGLDDVKAQPQSKPEGAVQPQPQEQSPQLDFKPPKWAGSPSYPYSLEVLKGGKIVDEVDISETSTVTVGRLPSCDLPCLHPSISRYHALFQHKTADDDGGGVYLYDLGSSYGTVVNKVKIRPKTYYRLKTGYVIKFGVSTRLYIVKGPPEEAFEDEKELQPKEEKVEETNEEKLSTMGILAAEEAETFLEMVKRREAQVRGEEEEEEVESGVSWGFREDARAEDDGSLKLDPAKMAKPADFKDPKKTLRGFFEREGIELEYMVTETGQGRSHQYICRVELPIDTPAPVFAEGTSSGKKRDAILACAVHGCRLLDAYGVLRRCKRYDSIETRTEFLKKNDYYDSDEDTFTDRTGEIELKRKRRMLRAGVEERKVTTSKTYDMLSADLKRIEGEMSKLEDIISNSKEHEVSGTASADSLDVYMATVTSSTVDAAALKEARKKLYDLKQERARTQKLHELAKPIALPEAKKLDVVPANVSIGKRAPKRKVIPTSETEGHQEVIKPVARQPHKDIPPKDHQKKIRIDLNKTKTHADPTAKHNETSSKSKLTDVFEVEPEPEPIKELYIPRRDDEEDELPASPPTHIPTTPPVYAPTTSLDNAPATSPTKGQPSGGKKRKRKRAGITAPTLTEDIKWDDDVYDEDFVSWVPPAGQTGDGKTKLNEKSSIVKQLQMPLSEGSRRPKATQAEASTQVEEDFAELEEEEEEFVDRNPFSNASTFHTRSLEVSEVYRKFRPPRQAWVHSFSTFTKQGLIELHPEVFAANPRVDLIYDVVQWQEACVRDDGMQYTRAELPGTGNKQQPQKGTGKARRKGIRAPNFLLGGKSNPTRPYDYGYDIGSDVLVGGFNALMTIKLAQGSLIVVDSLDGFTIPQLSRFKKKLRKETVLFVTGYEGLDDDQNTEISFTPDIDLLTSETVHPLAMLEFSTTVLDYRALVDLETWSLSLAGTWDSLPALTEHVS